MSEAFMLSSKMAEVFFRFCRRYKLVTEPERLVVMRAFVRKKQASYIRDPKEFLKNKNYGIIRRNNEEI